MDAIVLKAAIVIVIFNGMLCHLTTASDAASQTSEWCLVNDGQTPYQSALEYLNSSRIDEPGLDGIVQALFLRMECRRMARGNQSVCTECLTASNIYSALDLRPDETLSELLFENASVIILSYILQLDAVCQSPQPDWNQVHLLDFIRQLLQLSDGPHPNNRTGSLGVGQLESWLRSISGTYMPGPMTGLDGQCGLEQRNQADMEKLCAFGNLKTFSSSDILFLTKPNSTDQGIHADEFGRLSSIILAKLLSGDCISRTEDGVPNKDEFVNAIFQTHATNNSCGIARTDLETIATALNIGQPSMTSSGGSTINVTTTCLSVNDLLRSFELDNATQLTKTQFIELCPALLQQSTQGCRHVEETAEPDNSKSKLSFSEVYGYGTFSVLIISILPPFSVIIVRWRKTPAYKYIITSFLGLSIGSLVGDAVLHLIPQLLDLEGTGGEGVPMYVWKTLCVCGAIWFYFGLQLFLLGVGDAIKRRKARKSKSHSAQHLDLELPSESSTDCHANCRHDSQDDIAVVIPKCENESKDDQKKGGASKEGGGDSKHGGGDDSEDNVSLVVHAHSSVGWMVTVGGSLHNFTDGLAIGAAFSNSWQIGLSTSIAIFTHEVPHEFGDSALLLSTGWSAKKVVIFHVLSQMTAFVGLYIGISVSADTDQAQQWIFATAAGMFLYISLADAAPEIMELFAKYESVGLVIGANIGILIGFACMLLLAIYEDKIAI